MARRGSKASIRTCKVRIGAYFLELMLAVWREASSKLRRPLESVDIKPLVTIRLVSSVAVFVFCAWRLVSARIRDGVDVSVALCRYDRLSHDYILATVYAAIHLRRSFPVLKRALKEDYAWYWNDLSSKIVVAEEEDDAATLFWAVKVMRLRPPNPLPMLMGKEGNPAKSPIHSRRVMQEYFAEMLRGDIVSLEDLSVENSERQADVFLCVLDLPRDISLAPNHFQLNDLCRAVANGKGHGEDNITSTAVAHFHSTFARTFMVPMLKAAMRIQEPLDWKGGPMVEFLKNAMSSF